MDDARSRDSGFRYLWRVIVGVWKIMGERNLGLISAGVAFYAMLSIFPAVAAIIALLGFLADPGVVERQMQLLADFLPADAHGLLSRQVDRLVSANDSTLGWATTVSLAAAIWSARLGVAAMMRGLTAIYGRTHRGGVQHLALAIVLTGILITVAIVALLAVLVLPVVLAFLPLGPFTGMALGVANWALGVGVVLGGVSILYRYGPSRNGPRTRWLSPGLGLAILLWGTASFAFARFLANFGNYNEVYGSIGAVIALLMWFYITAYAVLLGGALNAELERLGRSTSDAPPAQ